MGLIERLRRWLREKPLERTAPAYHHPTRDEKEDEEIAELIAIDII